MIARLLIGILSLSLVMQPACQSPVDSIASSHIDANVPDQKEFDRILRQDLEAYFRSKTKNDALRVEYEFLRNGPTPDRNLLSEVLSVGQGSIWEEGCAGGGSRTGRRSRQFSHPH
jgi:hypothetical protein